MITSLFDKATSFLLGRRTIAERHSFLRSAQDRLESDIEAVRSKLPWMKERLAKLEGDGRSARVRLRAAEERVELTYREASNDPNDQAKVNAAVRRRHLDLVPDVPERAQLMQAAEFILARDR